MWMFNSILPQDNLIILSVQFRIYFLIVIKDYETTSTSSIIGSVVAVILVVAVVVIGIFLWKRNRRYFQ